MGLTAVSYDPCETPGACSSASWTLSSPTGSPVELAEEAPASTGFPAAHCAILPLPLHLGPLARPRGEPLWPSATGRGTWSPSSLTVCGLMQLPRAVVCSSLCFCSPCGPGRARLVLASAFILAFKGTRPTPARGTVPILFAHRYLLLRT